jgi:hypothetical protein
MKSLFVFRNIKYRWLIMFTLLMACVEKVDFQVPPAKFQIVVEGFISDSPGPYSVTISEAMNVDLDGVIRVPITSAILTLFDDQGNLEKFSEVSPGTYSTAGIIQGKVGHAYHIRIETLEGKIFESEPDVLHPVGEVEEIRFEYEKRTVVKPYGEVPADVFNIYVDADAGSEEDNYVRWRFTGTYKVITDPKEHSIWNPPYTPYRSPFPCSGYILTGGPGGGLLVQVGDCECCTCWAKQFENVPQLSDMQLITGSKFRNVKVGEVPINNNTFYEKYMVEIEQMSLSREAFEFFKLIRSQKESASSIFQPPSGEIRGNIKAFNNSDPIIGLFYATSLRKKSTFIQRSDVPYPVTPIEYKTYPCYEAYGNASTTKPDGWE